METMWLPKEAHKKSANPAWDGKEGMSGETFRERESVVLE